MTETQASAIGSAPVKKLFLLLCLALLSYTALGGVARAESRGLLLSPSALPAASQRALQDAIASMRRERPEPFAALARLAAEAPALQARARGRAAQFTPLLRALGPDALLPMLELLAFSAREDKSLDDGSGVALRVGLLEAVGHLRDARALPVLTGILAQHAGEHDIARAAAFALGALGSEEAAQQLIALSRLPGNQGGRAGMGSCRRAVVADELARALARESRPELRRQLIDALGEVGNAWAFRTPAVTVSAAEQARIRSSAAQALVQAFVHDRGSLRDAADNALMVVDAPETARLIAQERVRSTDPALRAALDALTARLARNPTR